LLFGENLAARLVQALADLYPGSAHVSDVALAPAPDRAIWTQDEDFHRLSVLHGPPPKVIWVRLGNCSTDDVIRLLQARREEIDAFLALA